MAPEFALFLSPDGIALAHRQPAGHWAVLSDTALDVPDLPAALAAMRQQGEDRAGPGFATLVILPDDQILFTSLTAPGPEDADRLAQIHDGLDGLTPYTVSDLAFDYVPLEDGRVKLAVAARETLAEAEGFAREHGFEPAGFAARPLDNRFPGVAHFDRSPDWTKSIADIEFGHDSWQKANDKREDAIEEAPAVEEGSAEAATEVPRPPEGAPSAAPPDAEPVAAPTPTSTTEPTTAPDADPSLARDAEPEAQAVAAKKDSQRPRPEPELTDPIAPDSPEVEAPATEPPAQPGPFADAAPLPGATDARDNAAQVSAHDEPLQIPSGFGAGRARDATPDEAVDRVGARPSRLAMGGGDAAPPEPARAPAGDPDKTMAQPRFGRGRSKSAAAATDTTPKRPEAAGPAPDLPPLTRTKLRARRKSKDKATPPPRPDLPSPDPEVSGAGAAPDHAGRPSARDRLSGMGKRLSAGAEKARDTASGLTAKRKPDTGTSTGSAAGSAGIGSITARLKSLGRKGQTTVPEGPDARPGSGDASQPKAIPIAPPPPRPSVTERAGATPPALTDADTSLTGGMLGRGLRSGGRGPSLRAGLILTLILLVVLGLIAIWAVFYLPDTALARWLGIERQEAGIEQVGPAPQIPDGPQLSAVPPQGEDTAPAVTSLTPEASAPQVTGIPPQAPDLLPDIDADLDLGPMPVAVPRVDPETLLPTIAETEDFYARTGIWQRPPVIDLPAPETVLEGVILAGIDPQVTSVDAYALPMPSFDPAADLPRRQSSPVDPATAFVFDENGLVVPTPEGTLNPDGILVIAGAPVVTPVPRPGDAPAAALAAEAADPTAGAIDTALLGTRRPPGRPADLQEQRERALLGGITFDELARIRPEGRPASIQELAAAEAQAAHDQADAATEAAEVGSTSEWAVAVSFVPRARPGNIDEIVQTARAASPTDDTRGVASTAGGAGAVAPVAARPSDTVVPDIPSSASVTRAATRENAINLHRINLIGVTGSDSDRRALVRLPSGRFVTVGTGDRLDGGQVAAIGQTTLQYVKSGRTVTLEIPSG